MGSSPLIAWNMSAFSSDKDYNQMLSYLILRNMEALASTGFRWRFTTDLDSAAFTSEADSMLAALEAWSDSAFTVGDKDSRALPVPLPKEAISSLCLMLPPPANMIALAVVQIALRVLDSKLEAASEREALKPVEAVLSEIRDALQNGLLEDSGKDADGDGENESSSVLARVAFAAESLRKLGVSCSIDDLLKLRNIRLDFGGLMTDEVDGIQP